MENLCVKIYFHTQIFRLSPYSRGEGGKRGIIPGVLDRDSSG